MNFSNIILRILTDPIFTTKGSKLTWQELDANFIALKDEIKLLQVGGNVAPYNPGNIYSNVLPDYVSHGGNLWVYINGTPASGQTPPTPPASSSYWQLTSAGSLSHQQNTDIKLAAGTANEVDAAIAHELIYNQVITLTQSSFAISLNAGLLKANRFYFISDANYPLIIQATGTKHFAKSGKYLLRVPYTNNSGNWLSDTDGGTYAINTNLIFGTLVYKNLTGINTDLTPPNDTTNWEMYARSDSHYTDKWLSIDVTFFGGVFTFESSSFDSKLNNTLTPFQIGGEDYLFRDNHANNRCNNLSVFDGGIFVGNYIGDLFQCETDVNSGIQLAAGDGQMSMIKTLNNGILDVLKRMDGIFSNVSVENCNLKFEDGLDSGISIQNLNVKDFFPSTILKGRPDTDIILVNVSPQGSNLQDTIVLTPLVNLNLALNGVADLFGEFTILDNSITIETILNYHGLFPVKLKPRAGNSFKINSISAGSATADNQLIISPGYLVGNLEFDYSLSQHLVLVKRFIDNGFNCILINIIPE